MVFKLFEQVADILHQNIYYRVFVLCFILLFVIIPLLFYLVRKLPKRTFYSRFYTFQRFRSIILRYYDYYSYWIRHQVRAQPIKFVFKFLESLPKLYFLTSLMTFVTISSINKKIDFSGFYSVDSLISVIGFVLLFIDWLNSNNDYTKIQKEDSLFKNIEPPKDWMRISLSVDASNPNQKQEYVYINRKVNCLLRGNKDIGICRNVEHENGLIKQICNETLWNHTFFPFLYQKYRETGYNGSQFYNEEKFGLSEDPEQIMVQVHKTCYFDTYLTNIIPGNVLIRNCDKKKIGTTEELMPYREEYEIGTHKKKTLYEMAHDGICRSNEVGISTLFLIDGAILFWEQSPYALSSVNRIAPSGSGSSDWDDCKNYFNDPNGLRQSVVFGMQRELWEESYSNANQVSMEKFMNSAETRIIGYFRWLDKSAKPEFVGVTRICPDKVFESYECIVPEFMEVKGQKFIKAKTIGEFLYNFKNTVKIVGSVVQIDKHSVPSAMAIYYLKEICAGHCTTCPHVGQTIRLKKRALKNSSKFSNNGHKNRITKIQEHKKCVFKTYGCNVDCPYDLQNILFTPGASVQVSDSEQYRHKSQDSCRHNHQERPD